MDPQTLSGGDYFKLIPIIALPVLAVIFLTGSIYFGWVPGRRAFMGFVSALLGMSLLFLGCDFFLLSYSGQGGAFDPWGMYQDQLSTYMDSRGIGETVFKSFVIISPIVAAAGVAGVIKGIRTATRIGTTQDG